MLLSSSFFHVPIPLFFRRSSWDFLIFCHKSRLELFNLLVILDNLTFDLGDNFLGLRNVLSLFLAPIVDRLRLASVQWCARNLGPTLHLRWKVSGLKLGELVLDLFLVLSCDRSTFIVVVYLMLGRVYHRIGVLNPCSL